ncbi:MAG: hypothetical protein U0641_01210 [Anaerolineae bacterium]
MQQPNLRAMLVCVGAVALILVALGVTPPAGAAPIGAPTPAEAVADAAPHRAPAPRTPTVTVTYRDNNSTLNVQRSSTIVLALDLGGGGFFNWRDVTVDPTYLKPIAPSHQGIFQAQRTGTTTITAVGDPKCYPRCLAPSVLFTLKVVIG